MARSLDVQPPPSASSRRVKLRRCLAALYLATTHLVRDERAARITVVSFFREESRLLVHWKSKSRWKDNDKDVLGLKSHHCAHYYYTVHYVQLCQLSAQPKEGLVYLVRLSESNCSVST